MRRHLRVFIPLLTLIVLATACSGGDSKGSSPAATVGDATPTGSATEMNTTGDPTVDVVLASVAEMRPERLIAVLGPTNVPCADDYSIGPVCQGAPAGSPLPSIWSFQCEARWVPLGLFTSSSATIFVGQYHLYAVTRGGPAVGQGPVVLPVDRWLLFDGTQSDKPAAMAIAVTNERVVALGYSCSDGSAFKLTYTSGANGFLVAPTGH